MRPQQIVTHNNLLWLWALLLIIPLVIPTQASDTETVTAQLVFHVDDNALNDPGPGDPSLSDPNEDGTSAHPYDDILEVLEALKDYDYPEPDDDYTIQIVVEPGVYQATDESYEIDLDFISGGRGGSPIESLALVSSDPNDFSIVAQTLLDFPIYMGYEKSELAGFTLRGSYFTGIEGDANKDAIIRNCIIQGNKTCDGTVLSDFGGLLKNCLIADNQSTGDCGQRYVIDQFHGSMENCTITGNDEGIYLGLGYRSSVPEIQIRNCIIYNHENSYLYEDGEFISLKNEIEIEGAMAQYGTQIFIDYSNIDGGLEGIYFNLRGGRGGSLDIEEIEGLLQWGETNVDLNPRFVRTGSWERVIVDGNEFEAYFPGDYHLQTRGWRWTEQAMHDSHWTSDLYTSPCIDIGDPNVGLGNEFETVPSDMDQQYTGVNRGINMGVYGGTTQASLAPVIPDSNELEYWLPLWPVSSYSAED